MVQSKLSFLRKTRTFSRLETDESQNSPAQSSSAGNRRSFNSHRDNEQQNGGLSPRKSWTSVTSVTSVFSNILPKNKTNKRGSSATFDASSAPQPKPEAKETTETKAEEEVVVEHRVQENPDLDIRSKPGSPDTQGVQPRDDTEFPMVTSNHTSLGTGTAPTPGDSPEAETENKDTSESEGLGSLILDKMEESKLLSSGEFLPEGLLVKFLTNKSVYRELTEDKIPSDDVNDLVDFALHHARKIFATLLLLNQKGETLQRAMQYFRRDKIGDDFLPITDETRDKIPFLVNREGPWGRVAEKNFRQKQWAFLAPELPPRKADEPILRIDANIPLPFIEAEKFDSGAFGDVYKTLPSESNIRLPELKVSPHSHDCQLPAAVNRQFPPELDSS